MTKHNVLFLCTGNSARSLMAEALLRDRAGDLFDVFSAGTAPRGVNPLTLRVLREIGVDTERLRSKRLEEYRGWLSIRFLIVVCAAADRACPTAWPGVEERHFWRIEDPAKCEDTEDDPLDRFREVRDEIDERIAGWLTDLRDQSAAPTLVA
ncbi:MAG: arsenate reductase ArsC [Pirellulales bacterium]